MPIQKLCRFVYSHMLIPPHIINPFRLYCDLTWTKVSKITIIIPSAPFSLSPDWIGTHQWTDLDYTLCLGQMNARHWPKCKKVTLVKIVSDCLAWYSPTCCQKKLSLYLSSIVFVFDLRHLTSSLRLPNISQIHILWTPLLLSYKYTHRSQSFEYPYSRKVTL